MQSFYEKTYGPVDQSLTIQLKKNKINSLEQCLSGFYVDFRKSHIINNNKKKVTNNMTVDKTCAEKHFLAFQPVFIKLI